MYYKDLIQFDPINTLIQLREADDKSKAKNLVSSYVISKRMAEQLCKVVIPQMQFQKPVDNKGILIVGNYGTGKSHLMSMISGVAEYEELLPYLDSQEVQESAKDIAGKFHVIRTEIGSVTASLRDLLLAEIEKALQAWGTPYQFPNADEITNNKDSLIEAVAAFQEKYPDQGILLIVDELLDFLRTKEERSLILDLGFLREMGEVAALTPFRFIGGLQETLFDNPRFQFVAEQLRRVKDRFEQIRIVRDDIAYVVSNRLLKKSDHQKAQITEHLRSFTTLYKDMAENLDEYVTLFPIHPAYIDTFEDIFVAEKRQVLKTFSTAMQNLLEKEVPKQETGLISYDHYWAVLSDDPSMRTIPEVAEVIDKSAVLSGRIKNAYTREMLKPMAGRIIDALSVLRLTTHDIYAPIGATPEELRDNLCLYVKMPEKTSEFLLDQVQVALREIMRTVSGQYITYNEDNDQYYLDVKKDIDFEAKITGRGEFMETSDLNSYFFDAMQRILTMSDTTYVSGYKIWEYQIAWQSHKVTRPGYLFLGKPDQRSTAQPPRDFYIYITPPFDSKDWNGDVSSNEIIFQFDALTDEFEAMLRYYAGARAMSNEAATHREIYADKSDSALIKLIKWLREHNVEHLHVTYQGVTKPISTVIKKLKSSSSQNFKELVDLIAAHLLEPQFEDQYPHYPSFQRLKEPISEESRESNAREAVHALSGRRRTILALAILDGLQLLDQEENIRALASPYAQKFLQILQDKEPQQVVNRSEIIEIVATYIEPIEKDIYFQLETDWVMVVLLALVYSGDIVININPKVTLDAGNIEHAGATSFSELCKFRHYSRPKELPLGLWTMIFEGMGLAPGLIKDENERDNGLGDLQERVLADLNHTAALENRIQQGLNLWNEPIFTDSVGYVSESGVLTDTGRPEVTLSKAKLLPRIRGYKQFLEELSKFNTTGKLRNLRFSASQIEEAFNDKQAVEKINNLLDLINNIQPITSYLVEAQSNLPEEHDWSERAAHTKKELIETIRKIGSFREINLSAQDIERKLLELKNDYIQLYAQMHHHMVLGPQGDEFKKKLMNDKRLKTLQNMSSLNLLNETEFLTWKEQINKPKICLGFHEQIIQDTPTCPHCKLKPKETINFGDANQCLYDLEGRLDDMLTRWRKALRENLSSQTAQNSLEAMSPAERAPIEAFLDQELDEVEIPEGFVNAANQALQGITAITLPVEGLIEALKSGGLPSTVEEMQRRFHAYLQDKMRGHAAQHTRLTLDQ
jgi:energy-coupling factor transporter ATP-binding protein EcfA2